MYLSIKEMELRKVRFDETFAPGQIDFSDAEVQQVSPLHTEGSAELLAHTGGEVRIRGKYDVRMETECDRCLGRAEFPIDSSFDLFYRPMSVIAREEEIEIDEGEAEIGFYQGDRDGTGRHPSRTGPVTACPCRGSAPKTAKASARCAAGTATRPACDCHAETSDDRWGALRKLSNS